MEESSRARTVIQISAVGKELLQSFLQQQRNNSSLFGLLLCVQISAIESILNEDLNSPLHSDKIYKISGPIEKSVIDLLGNR